MLRPSAIALVVANLVPLVGVWLFDWKVIDILMLYWAENVIIGVVNILRLAVCREGKSLFLVVFFMMHYGIFCYGHLMAITGIFSDAFVNGTARDYFFGLPFFAAWKTPLWIAIGGIAASHLFSFFANFIAGGEYLRTNANTVMHRPYGRVVVLHVAIVIGAALIEWLGSPVMMLVALVAAKIALDLRLHLVERETFSAAPVGA